MADKKSGEYIGCRATAEQKRKFNTRCDALRRTPSDVLKEIIDAFNDGRLRIRPSRKQQEAKDDLYES